jgi:hypothetical protein
MTTRNAFKFVVVLALVFAVAGGYGVFTAKASGRAGSSVLSLAPSRVVTPKETLSFQRSLSGDPGIALSPGVITPIDGMSMTCPGPGTCLYEVDEWIQINASAATPWSVLSSLDGNYMTGGGPFDYANTTNYVTGSWSESSTHVNPGSHKVQSYAYVEENAGTAYYYNFTYRVMKP